MPPNRRAYLALPSGLCSGARAMEATPISDVCHKGVQHLQFLLYSTNDLPKNRATQTSIMPPLEARIPAHCQRAPGSAGLRPASFGEWLEIILPVVERKGARGKVRAPKEQIPAGHHRPIHQPHFRPDAAGFASSFREGRYWSPRRDPRPESEVQSLRTGG